MRKVAHVGKHCEIQIGKALWQSVAPRVRKHRIVLRPANAGWYFNGRECGSKSLHHRLAACVGTFVVGKTSFEIARLEEIVHEDFKNIVKRMLAPRPML